MNKCRSDANKGGGCCGGKAKSEAHEMKQDTKTSPALEILKERFARGEIDKAEFEEKREVILAA